MSKWVGGGGDDTALLQSATQIQYIVSCSTLTHRWAKLQPVHIITNSTLV